MLPYSWPEKSCFIEFNFSMRLGITLRNETRRKQEVIFLVERNKAEETV